MSPDRPDPPDAEPDPAAGPASADAPEWRDEREIRIAAQAPDVWAAWAEPAHVARWFSDEARGVLEPGGEIVHVFHGHGEHRYRVVECEPPVRLVLEGEMGGAAFRQEVVIEHDGGVTILRLVHSGFGHVDPDSEVTQGIDSGWTGALALLKLYTERYLGRPKASRSVFRPASFEYARLREHFYATPEGLGSWLTDGGGALEPGRPVALRLRSGTALSGEVLAGTAHEISVSWTELGGALELKAFGSGPGARVLGTRVTSWSADAPARVERVRPELEEAVERLLSRV